MDTDSVKTWSDLINYCLLQNPALSLDELAKEVGLNRRTLYTIRSGQTMPKDQTKRKLLFYCESKQDLEIIEVPAGNKIRIVEKIKSTALDNDEAELDQKQSPNDVVELGKTSVPQDKISFLVQQLMEAKYEINKLEQKVEDLGRRNKQLQMENDQYKSKLFK